MEDIEPLYRTEADFDKLWKRRDRPPLRTFSDDADEIEATSFVFRSFRNEFETEHLFTNHVVKLVKSGKLDFEKLDTSKEKGKHNLESKIPGFKISSFIATNSSLNRAEMTECFNIYLEICNNKTLSSEKLDKYNKYLPLIQAEQMEYLDMAKNTWLRGQGLKKTKEIPPEVMQFISSFWKTRLERLSWYPKFYSEAGMIPLVDQSERKVEMTFIKSLRKIGSAPYYFLPRSAHRRLSLYTVVDLLEPPLPNKSSHHSYKRIPPPLSLQGFHPHVSRDEIGGSLAVEHGADVVLCSSSFLSLLDNHLESEPSSWHLPVLIKHLPTADPEVKKKVVFIDKALPPNSLTVVERIKLFSKMALKHLVAHPPSSTSRKSCPMDLTPSDYDLSSLETFGISSGGASCSREVGDMQRSMEAHTHNGGEGCQDDEKNEPVNVKYLYNLWAFKNESSSQLLKTNLKELKLIIRCKQGGRHKSELGKDVTHLSSKLEYQPEFGAEQMSLSEITRDWANTKIRPLSYLTRVRVDAETGETIMFEKKTVDELRSEWERLYSGGGPSDRIKSLQTMLVRLTAFPAGCYLLTHQPRHGPFAPLLNEAHSGHTFNLGLSYQGVDVEAAGPTRAPWTPLDLTVVTPTFSHFRRVPATFHPKRASPFSSTLAASRALLPDQPHTEPSVLEQRKAYLRRMKKNRKTKEKKKVRK